MPLGYGEDPHCGPFNKIKRKVRSRLDAICRRHDIGYHGMGPKAYFLFNKYDKRFIRDMKKEPGFKPWMYRKFFEIKEKIAPVYSEKKQLMGSKRKAPEFRGASARKKARTSSNRRSGGTQTTAVAVRSSASKSVSQGGGSAVGTVNTRKIKSRGKKHTIKSKALLVDGNVVPGASVQKRLTNMAKTGVVLSYKARGQLADNDCVYVGASSMPQEEVLQGIVASMLKSFVRRCGWRIRDIEEAVPFNWYGTAQQAKLLLSYASTSGSGSGFVWQYIVPNALVTFWDIVLDCTASLTTFIGNNLSDRYLDRLIFQTESDAAESGMDIVVNLVKARIKIYSNSTFKIQNQSYRDVAGTEEDNALDVHNIPLIGKGYEFKGASILMQGINRFVTYPFAPTAEYGIIRQQGSVDTLERLKEPPLKNAFQSCRNIGDVGVAPGEIKSSLVVDYESHYLNNFIWKIYAVSLGSNFRNMLGSSRMFGLKKQIDTDLLTSVSNITVKFEHFLQLGCVAAFGQDIVTTTRLQEDEVF